MKPITYVFCALQILSTFAVIVLVMLQKLKEGNGITETSNEGASGMGMSNEKKLSRLTVIAAVAFVVFTICASTLLYQEFVA